jgi:hypothetical protein
MGGFTTDNCFPREHNNHMAALGHRHSVPRSHIRLEKNEGSDIRRGDFNIWRGRQVTQSQQKAYYSVQ